MKQKTRILIYILIAIAVVIMGTLAILENHNEGTTVSAQEHIDLGRIYLAELSYEKAVLEFTEAIEIEPLNADAYLGLADAYVGMGDIEKAVETLEEGYEKTGDERLKDMLGELMPNEETILEAAIATGSDIYEDTIEGIIGDTSASYTIDVISDKEAHIEISSYFISEEYINKNFGELWCFVTIDNLEFGVFNFKSYGTYKDWNNGIIDLETATNIYAKTGANSSMMFYYYYSGNDEAFKDWFDYGYADANLQKIFLDVKLPSDYDFSFNSCNYDNATVTSSYQR